MDEKFELYADIPCRLVHNENGVFLVFPSNMETEVAAALFVGWENISSFGQYDNALKMIEPTFDSESVTLIKEDYEICVQKETTDNEESGKFTNFHNWQMIAIESGCTIVVGMVNAIYGAYKEEELVGIYNMMDNIGWLDWE